MEDMGEGRRAKLGVLTRNLDRCLCKQRSIRVIMSDLQTEFNQCLFHSSSALHRWLERIAEKHFKKVGLTPTQGFILMTLKEAPGITVTDLATVHQVVPSTITRMLNSLGSSELIHREQMGRITRVFATSEGQRKEVDARAAWKKLQHQYKDLIGAIESKRLSEDITQAIDRLANS